MTNNEFLKLLTEHANKTTHIRAFNAKWSSGAHRIPEEILGKIGCLVSLLQDQIDKGLICNKNEYLLIYNFQPLHITDKMYLCSLDMVIKPIAKLNEVNISKGVPTQLVVNGTNGEVMNNTRGMVEMEFISDNDLEEEEEGSILYGNYHDYSEPLFNNQTREQGASNNQPKEVQWLSFSEKLKALQTVIENYRNQEQVEIQKNRAETTNLAKDIYLSFQNKLAPSLDRESSAIDYFNGTTASTHTALSLKI